MTGGLITYSVVVPALNEEENMLPLHARLLAIFGNFDGAAELIIVDDGSVDATVAVAKALDGPDLAVRVISFSRNFGHQAALTAGIDLSVGDAVILMDADLQDPPETIVAMIAKWEEGNDVVYGVRSRHNEESLFKRHSARWFYRLLDSLTAIDVPIDANDFRLMDRRVVDALGHLREDDRYLRGMIAWLGFKQAMVVFDRPDRMIGETKFTLSKMVRLAMTGIVGFSDRPLRLATSLGFVFSIGAFAIGIFTIAQKIAGDNLVPGWASILVVVTFIGGIQLLVMGIFGEYLGRVHSEVRRRPIYVVRDLHGFTTEVVEPRRAVVPGVTNCHAPAARDE